MTEEQLIGIQNIFFDMSKKLLLTEGRAEQVGFIITGKGNEDKVLEGGQYNLQYLPGGAEKENADHSVLFVDMEPDDDVILQQLSHLDPSNTDIITQAVAMGMSVFGMSRDKAITSTLDVVLSKIQANRKDIVAWTVREICKSTKAFAFIHVCEAYCMQMEAEEGRNYNRSLADDERSTECLMSSMESYNFRRMMVASINREPSPKEAPRDTGKVISVEDPQSTIDRDFKDLGGRFMQLLPLVD